MTNHNPSYEEVLSLLIYTLPRNESSYTQKLCHNQAAASGVPNASGVPILHSGGIVLSISTYLLSFPLVPKSVAGSGGIVKTKEKTKTTWLTG